MKILLCSFEEGVRGISIRYLSSYLKENGFSVGLLFLDRAASLKGYPAFLEKEVCAVAQFIAKNEVEYIGLSLMTENFYEAKSFIREIKKRCGKVKFISGGIHATLCPQECIGIGSDLAVIASGERPLKRILSAEGYERITGICYQDNRGVLRLNHPDDQDLPDLSNLPFPDYSFNNEYILGPSGEIKVMNSMIFRRRTTWGGRYYPLLTSRGCIYNCAYCCNYNRLKVKRNSVGHVMEELLYVKNKLPFTEGLNIQDDSFYMGSDDYLVEFSKMVRSRLGWPLIARMMSKYVTEERVRILKNGGLEFVSIGLQASDRINKELYDRPETAEAFIGACRILSDNGIKYVVDVIIDNPYETDDDLREVVETLNSIPKPFMVNAFSLTVFPRTRLWERVQRDGMADKFLTDAFNKRLLTYSFNSKFYQDKILRNPPGKYVTPLAWRKLIAGVAGLSSKQAIVGILENGVTSKNIQKKIDFIYFRNKLIFQAANGIKERNILLFRLLEKFFCFFWRII